MSDPDETESESEGETEEVKTTVHILATVRKAELLPAAKLVFDSLRVGFPDARVITWGNNLQGDIQSALQARVESVGGEFRSLPPTVHDVWIEMLVRGSFQPFWIVDTDVVFFGPTRTGQWPEGTILAGRYEPEFFEEWTGTRHMERLHTAVMWIDPSGLRNAAREWMARIPMPWRRTAEFPWVRQCFVPEKDLPALFYDTMAGVYHAFPGRCAAFSEPLDECFEHLCCGSYVDLVAAGTESGFGERLQAFHKRVFTNPDAAMGARFKQAEYYESRKGPTCNTRQE